MHQNNQQNFFVFSSKINSTNVSPLCLFKQKIEDILLLLKFRNMWIKIKQIGLNFNKNLKHDRLL